jgi:hypothetical protein
MFLRRATNAVETRGQSQKVYDNETSVAEMHCDLADTIVLVMSVLMRKGYSKFKKWYS